MSKRNRMAIIKAITNLGSSLGIPTLAEGVETKKQLGLLCSPRNRRQTDEYLLTA